MSASAADDDDKEVDAWTARTAEGSTLNPARPSRATVPQWTHYPVMVWLELVASALPY